MFRVGLGGLYWKGALSENRGILQRMILGSMLINIAVLTKAMLQGSSSGWRRDCGQNDGLFFVFGAIWWAILKNRLTILWTGVREIWWNLTGEKWAVKLLQTKYKKDNQHLILKGRKMRLNKTIKLKTKMIKLVVEIQKFHNRNISTIFSNFSRGLLGT